MGAFGWDFGWGMGHSELDATPSAPPPQPRLGKSPAGQDPEARLNRSRSPQQRSDQARKPLNSEQHSCSFIQVSEVSIACLKGPLERKRTISSLPLSC